MEKQLSILVNILKNGSQILVEGRIQTGSYDKQDGTKVYTTDLIIERLFFCGGNKQENNKTENFEDFAQQNDISINTEQGSDLPF